MRHALALISQRLRLYALEQSDAGAGAECGLAGQDVRLITGYTEAGETPEGGMVREIVEEANLETSDLKLIGAYDFQRMNQVIIAYHAVCRGEMRLSPEPADCRLFAPEARKC